MQTFLVSIRLDANILDSDENDRKAGKFIMKRWILTLLLLVTLAEPVAAAEYDELTAVGRAVGIRLQEPGITVTGFSESGNASKAGLRKGDRILRINGEPVEDTAQIRAMAASGEALRVTVERGGAEADYLVEPVRQEGQWLLGIKVRDSVSGIGTITFYDSGSGAYGALGHGVCAAGSGKLLKLSEGELIDAEVSGVEMGRCGAAGQLLGSYDETAKLGDVRRNTERGIFGSLKAGQQLGRRYPVAERAEVRTGEAVILSNVSGREVREYTVQIRKLYPMEGERNLLLEVTDPALLSATGGIVQGMSGSPIIQNGKLVGAVTHVLVNDPTRGYGIFIENMLDAAA